MAVAEDIVEDIAEADSLGLLERFTEADSPAAPVEDLALAEHQQPVMPSGPNPEVVAVEALLCSLPLDRELMGVMLNQGPIFPAPLRWGKSGEPVEWWGCVWESWESPF